MMKVLLVFCLSIMVAMVVGLVILPRRRKNKLLKQIKSTFGKVPQIRQRLFNSENFWSSTVHHDRPISWVDDLTWHDLDMDEVFHRINVCHSSLGDVWLYKTLRLARADEATTQEREEKIELFQKNEALRHSVQLCLAQLGRNNGSSLDTLLMQPQTLRLRYRWLYRIFALLPVLSLGLVVISSTLAVYFVFGSLILNAFLMLILKGNHEEKFIVVRYLSSIIHCTKRTARLLNTDAPQLASKMQESAKAFKRFERSMAVLQFNEVFTEGIGILCPLSLFLLPMLSYAKIAASLSGLSEEIEALYTNLGEIDLAIALLSYRESLPYWSEPTYHNKMEICMEEIYHPLLGASAVANSACFSNDVLVTGSNASGKSTFIKAIAVNIILSQAINTCTARVLSLRKGVIATSMAVSDDIVEGDSYFIAEIKSMYRLLSVAQRDFAYLFIDEILKGTNTIERVAAASSVIEYLHEQDCLCFAATHDMELTTILFRECENVHFREIVDENGVRFDYKLQSGPAVSRNAIRLLETMRFPGRIISAANQRVELFETTGKWITEDSQAEIEAEGRN